MLGTVLPVILIFLFGIWCKRKVFLSENTMKEIKKFVMSVSLPCVLFQTFMNMQIDTTHITLLILSFGLFIALMIGGKLCNLIPALHYKYNPYMCTGYSFGLVGLVLFSIIYGQENLELFSIMGLAHEVFVWVLYYLIFRIDTQNHKLNISTLINVLKSPIIISIILGTVSNICGITDILQANSLGQGLLITISYIANIATPFILIVLGYGVTFETKYLKQSAKIMGIRLLVTIIIGILFKILILDTFMSPNLLLDVSYISFLLLPPLFSLPLLVAEVDNQENVDIISSAIGIYTLISILVFIAFAFLVPLEAL